MYMPLKGVCAVLFSCSLVQVIAQSFAIPSSWTNATSSLGRTAREALAYNAADTLLANTNPLNLSEFGLIEDITSGFVVLTLQDYYSGNTTWNGTVLDGLQQYYANPGINSNFYNDAVYWALAYFYAYRTYKQQSYLTLAVAAYNSTYQGAFITPQDAATHAGAGRQGPFNIPPGCAMKEIAGGVFQNRGDPNATTINAVTITSFMALSAYLYEQSSQTFYLDAAQLSLEFILNYLWNGTIVYDSVTLGNCQVGSNELTRDQAWFIEGVAVLANVTNNATLVSLLNKLVIQSTTFPVWTTQGGIINETQGGEPGGEVHKGTFIRGLVEARTRNPSTELASYIEAFVMVQFNALQDNALSPHTNQYATSWLGPPDTSETNSLGNVAALDVLNAAFSFVVPVPSANGSVSTPPAGSASPPTSGSHHGGDTRPNIAAIVGAAAGGVALITAAAIYLLCRRRQKRSKAEMVVSELNGFNERDITRTVEPYLFHASPTNGQPPTSSTSSQWTKAHHIDGHDQKAAPSPYMVNGQQAVTVVTTQPAPLTVPESTGEDAPDIHAHAQLPIVPSASNLEDGQENQRSRRTRTDLATARMESGQIDFSQPPRAPRPVEERPIDEQPLTLADLPTLARHLYTLMQDQQAELPPQYRQ